MSKQTSTALKIAFVSVALSVMHASLYFLCWYLEICVHAKTLVITFWVSIIAILTLLYWVNKKPKIIIPAGIISILVILPTAESCLVWTSWSIYGFAP